MRVLTEGHKYVAANFENPEQGGQTIQFIEKVKFSELSEESKDGITGIGPDELVTVNNGTTNEEVIKVLIDRLGVLGKKFPCRENSLAVTKLEEALMWLEKRTADRKARGVEGQHKA